MLSTSAFLQALFGLAALIRRLLQQPTKTHGKEAAAGALSGLVSAASAGRQINRA